MTSIRLSSPIGRSRSRRRRVLTASLASRRQQPGADRFRFPDSVEVLNEATPGHLYHVGDIRLAEPVAPNHANQQSAIPLDDSLPRGFIAVTGSPDQIGEEARLAQASTCGSRFALTPRRVAFERGNL
jgi:hypothetical protein